VTDDLDVREWLEADGLGGFSSGTVSGIRTRRYHALLLAAATPPTGRQVLVNGLEVWLETPGGVVALSSQRYAPGVVHPDGASRIASFSAEPWPTWRFRVGDALEIKHEILVRRGAPVALATWRLVIPAEGIRLCGVVPELPVQRGACPRSRRAGGSRVSRDPALRSLE
jgi:predicted glycogen debranching enzyme